VAKKVHVEPCIPLFLIMIHVITSSSCFARTQARREICRFGFNSGLCCASGPGPRTPAIIENIAIIPCYTIIQYL